MQLKQIIWENRIVRYLLFILVLVYLFARALKGGDFDVYLFEANKLLHGQNIYKDPFFKNMPYTYSVFWAMLLVPFTFLPKVLTEFAWLVCDLFFLYRICTLLIQWLKLATENSQTIFYIFLLAFGLTIRFLLYNFSMIQMTIFLMYACMEGLELIHRKQNWAGSLLLGVAMNIKLLPLVMLPYLIYRKEFKAVFFTTMVFIVLMFIPGLFIGFEFNQTLLSDWWTSINPSSEGRMFKETMSGTVGLNSLIPVLLMDTIGELPYQRNFVNLPKETVALVLTVVRLILIGGTLYFLGLPPLRKVKDSIYQVWELSYIFAIIPLLAPQQQKYAFFFVFPAVLYLVWFFFQRKEDFLTFKSKRLNMLAIAFFVFFMLTTLTSDGFVGRKLNLIFQHYRTITYAGILLVLILLFCKPSKAISEIKQEN